MLYEVKNVKQIKDEHWCRWFTDEFFDLFVWFKSNGDIYGFQLCYDKLRNERALSWWEKSGFSHNKIDDGEINARSFKMTPILVANGTFDTKNIRTKFIKQSEKLDVYITEFILNKLDELH